MLFGGFGVPTEELGDDSDNVGENVVISKGRCGWISKIIIFNTILNRLRWRRFELRKLETGTNAIFLEIV